MLNLLTAGQCFGAAALFAPIAEYVTELQARKACRIVFISDQELTLLFQRYPQMALDYITFLSGRIQFLNQKIDSFTTPLAQEAVWNWLVAHANAQGCVTASGGLTRLAKELNIGRATLYRSLAHLEEKGYIVKPGRSNYDSTLSVIGGLIKMKKVVTWLLMAVMVVSLAACGSTDQDSSVAGGSAQSSEGSDIQRSKRGKQRSNQHSNQRSNQHSWGRRL